MFITFEGIEGVGKTTHLKFMAHLLGKAGLPILMTREPGGTEIGEEVREILLKTRKEPVTPMTELLLLFAARAQHIETVIRPALKRGQVVLCDRFIDATYAYQGGGRGISMDDITVLEKLVIKELRPTMTLLFDAPVAVGLSRIKNRSSKTDRFEQEKIEFFERVRATYELRAQKDFERYKILDASLPLEEVENTISKIAEDIIVKFQS